MCLFVCSFVWFVCLHAAGDLKEQIAGLAECIALLLKICNEQFVVIILRRSHCPKDGGWLTK